jgi:hypothetical protein
MQQAVEQTEIHAADELGVCLGEPMERTVVQYDDTVIARRRLEAAGFEFVEDKGSAEVDARAAPNSAFGFDADPPALFPRRVIDREPDWSPVPLGLLGRVGEETAGKLVVARRKIHRDL